MKVGTRIFFTVFILVILCVCAAILLAAFGVVPKTSVDALMAGFYDYALFWAIGAAIVFVLAFCLMFFGVGKAPEPSAVVLSATADGNVSITIPALEELAGRYLNEQYGILSYKTGVRVLSDRNVRFNLGLSLKPEVEIPALCKSVTEGIREHIEKYSGICVQYVEIKIMPLKTQLPSK